MKSKKCIINYVVTFILLFAYFGQYKYINLVHVDLIWNKFSIRLRGCQEVFAKILFAIFMGINLLLGASFFFSMKFAGFC
jgi:hypothetical protein